MDERCALDCRRACALDARDDCAVTQRTIRSPGSLRNVLLGLHCTSRHDYRWPRSSARDRARRRSAHGVSARRTALRVTRRLGPGRARGRVTTTPTRTFVSASSSWSGSCGRWFGRGRLVVALAAATPARPNRRQGGLAEDNGPLRTARAAAVSGYAQVPSRPGCALAQTDVVKCASTWCAVDDLGVGAVVTAAQPKCASDCRTERRPWTVAMT